VDGGRGIKQPQLGGLVQKYTLLPEQNVEIFEGWKYNIQGENNQGFICNQSPRIPRFCGLILSSKLTSTVHTGKRWSEYHISA
jgi:hypothetical protein